MNPKHVALEDGATDGAVATEVEAPAPRRKRGRPLLVSREGVLEGIRKIAQRSDGIYRTHLADPALYARARRMFGTWSAAVAAAGLDYASAVGRARAKSLQTRKGKRAI